MIKITGSIQRAFIFPALPEVTLSFYSELIRVAQLMPHISLVQAFNPNQIRVQYETKELNAYTIRIFTDLEGQVNLQEQKIDVYPVKIASAPPLPFEATNRETVGHGLFAIRANLFDIGDQTRIEASLELHAELLRPRGMKMMPKRVVNRIANSITENRIREMADGFIKASIDSFDCWLEEHPSSV